MRIVTALLLAAVLAVTTTGAGRAQFVMDVVTLITEIQRGDLSGVVEGVHAANTVYVARATGLFGISRNGERLTRVVERRDRVLRYFRSAIRGARNAQRALDIHGLTLDQVIWATYTNDGTATLYVDDR